MSNFFWITGYPRSRTAWLANLFTWGNSICLHDELAEHESVESFANRMHELSETYQSVGVSDSALTLFREPLMKHFPDSKWLLILRQRIDALNAFVKAEFAEHREATCYFRALEKAIPGIQLNGPAMMEIYSALNDIDTVKDIWHYILPNEPFPIERVQMLGAMRITQIKEKRNVNVGRIMKLAATIPEGVLV